MELLRPFELHLPDATLDEVHRRIRTFPWHEMPSDGGWEYGANLEYMKALCAYWLDGFDWRAQEAALLWFGRLLAAQEAGSPGVSLKAMVKSKWLVVNEAFGPYDPPTRYNRCLRTPSRGAMCLPWGFSVAQYVEKQ